MDALIPRVNLQHFQSGSPEQQAQFIETFGRGLCEVGFVIISGHDLDGQLTDQCYDLFRQFFELDQHVKDQYICHESGNRGYSPFGRERAKDAKLADLKEFWHVCQQLPVDYQGPLYYDSNLWPRELPALKDAALKLYRNFEDISQQLLRALALYFQLPRDRFSGMATHGNSVLRVIHYPALSGQHPQGAVRAAAHEDINLMTLLIESRGGGLQILTRDNQWIPVNSLKGDIIVDSGDMLKRVTNDRVQATTHRVVNPKEGENSSRYSMPFFVHPYPSCDLSVIDAFLSEDEPAKYSPVTAERFLNKRLKDIGLIPHSGRFKRVKSLT